MTTSTKSTSPPPVSELESGPARDRATYVAAVFVRVVVALLWLDNLDWKKPPDFGQNNNAGLYEFTADAVKYPVFSPFSSLVENVVLPHFTLFAWGVLIVEICLGTFLLLGLATRFWAVVGIGQALTIYLSIGATPGEWKWSYFMLIAALVAVLGLAAGRVWGLDSVLRRRIGADPSGRVARLYLRIS